MKTWMIAAGSAVVSILATLAAVTQLSDWWARPPVVLTGIVAYGPFHTPEGVTVPEGTWESPPQGIVHINVRNEGKIALTGVTLRIPKVLRVSDRNAVDGKVTIGDLGQEDDKTIYLWTDQPPTSQQLRQALRLYHNAGEGALTIPSSVPPRDITETLPFQIFMVLGLGSVLMSFYTQRKYQKQIAHYHTDMATLRKLSDEIGASTHSRPQASSKTTQG